MFSLKCMVLCISCFVVGSSASDLASCIVPCTPEDSDCIGKSAAIALPCLVKGDDELGISSIDPMHFNEVIADSGEMKLKFKDITVTGPSKAQFIKIERDAVKQTAKLVIELPISIIGKYTMAGTFLLVPIEGDGDVKIVTDKIRIVIDCKLKDFVKDGEKYYKVTGFDYKYELVEKVFIEFKNLFNGDKTRAEPVEKLVSENSKEMVGEFGGSVIKHFMSFCMENVNKLFKVMPAKQLEIA